MGSLFEGTPQTATSYTTSSSETPKWLQDAIYNQIQLATNVANTPYQAYSLPTVAQLSPLQQQAYANIEANQGAWQPAFKAATSGIAGLATAPGQSAAAQPYFNQQTGMLSGINYNAPVNTLTPYVDQSLATVGANAAQPYLTSAAQQAASAGAGNTAQGLASAQANYLNPALAQQNLASGANYLNQAGNLNIVGAAQPLTQQAANLATQAAGSTADVSRYMNPYQQSVMDVMAKQSARNLRENLMPAISDQFIKAGQFGGTRMGEFGSRALRDSQEALLNQQAQLANQGYTQAQQAAQADAARALSASGQLGNLGQNLGTLTNQQLNALANLGQAQLSAGQAQQQFGLTGAQNVQSAQAADLARQLSAAGQQANIGQTLGALTNAQQQAILQGGQALSSQQQNAIAQALSGAGQYGNLAQNVGALTGADLTRQQSALTELANLSGQGQQYNAADAAALEAAGAAQQANMQQQLTAAYNQYQQGVAYPKTQLDWLNEQIRGMAPTVNQTKTIADTTTGNTYSASPLSQLASAYNLYKGLTAK